MRSLDTNIVVRLLLRDDPAQVETVDRLVAEGGLAIGYTVLIELEWVLRAVYGLDRTAIVERLSSLAMIEGISVPDPAGLAWACARCAAGADFADMIHLLAIETATFLTFDRELVRLAGADCPSVPQLVS